MSGHNVNIYFQEKIYQKIKPLIAQRKVSAFVNQLVEKELEREEKVSKAQLIADYKATAQSKAMHEESKVWEGSIEDGIKDNE